MNGKGMLERLALLGLVVFGQMAFAQEEEVAVSDSGFFIGVTEDRPYVHVIHEGKSIKVQRVQDPEYELRGYFARTGRKCPPFCIRPMSASDGVETVGEIEVLDFMEDELRNDKGLLVDARTPAWHQKGTIPGSINVPFTVLSKPASDPEMIAIMKSFGAKPRGEVGMVEGFMEDWGLTDNSLLTKEWDFTDAKELMIWCNGPSCGQSPRAIKGLREAGYPAEKLHYYRGGMQIWQLYGFTTVIPGT
jgi:rhodanese-related sulfurtransferase